ncbi:sensor histidine kinase [Gemmobacter caeruleus]|uniref:sensor histidine kinase n=1 Tax=Gemmobacter caeruleus TaxID=2595004 RepID=UPI0011EDD30D|nr:sensor histidine kinase [Gemmobacter caeruleus]
MIPLWPGQPSLRHRLIWQIVALSALLAALLFIAVRYSAETASSASQDAVLAAAVNSIADGVRSGDDGLVLDLPYATFSILGAMGEERIFYSLRLGNAFLSGYEGLPAPPQMPEDLSPVFYDAAYRGADLRLAAITRSALVENQTQLVTVVLGQTRFGQAEIARHTARNAAWLGLGFLVLALPLAMLSVRNVLRPVELLTEAVSRRGPHDLRPVRHPAPRELSPLLRALNGFIARLRLSLQLAETFIFEAAHRIRTPLSLVRTEAELALSEAQDEATRMRLRRMIRAIGESSRSASQILDHAMVLYRSDQFEAAGFDLAALAAGALRDITPVAEMREIGLRAEGLETPCPLTGDARMIEVALRNLLDNALKYSDPDSTVTLRLSQTDETRLSICDQGRGLPADAGDLTERFRRGSNAGDVVGSGLGLTIVSEVALAHGGRFTLEPGKEGGTCATLILPRAD